MAFATVASFTIALSVAAAPTTKKTFDLPPGDAATTLKLYAQQSGEQIVYPLDQMRGVKTNAVKGELPSREALDQLLAGTDLVVVQDEKTGALSVRRDTRPNGEGATLAKTDVRPNSGKVQDGKLQLDKFQVIGRQIDGLNNKGLLQGGADAPLYHDVVTRADIDRMGVSSIEELFRLLPQTSSPANPLQEAVNNTQFTGGARLQVSTMGLRGFSNAQTVILINGRSLPRSGIADANGADLGRIPIAAIERIEILPYAGSAIYGSGAIGGAINIILRKEYAGKDLTVYAGTSTEGGASEYRVNYVDGRTFNGGRTNLTVTFSHQHRNSLLAGDRDYLDRALARYGPDSTIRTSSGLLAFEQFMLPAFVGSTPTLVISQAAPTAGLGIPGNPTARYATIPVGTTAAQSLTLTPDSFVATAGKFIQGNRFSRSVLYEPQDSYSLNAQVEHVIIKDRLSAYGEFTVGYNRKSYSYPQALSTTLSATDPLNPFRTNVTPGFVGRAVTVYFDPTDVPDSSALFEYGSARAVAGLKGKISERWEWSTDGVVDYTHNTITRGDPTTPITQLNGLTVAGQPAAASAAIRRAIYPLLADHGASPNSASDTDTYFRNTTYDTSRAVQKEANARITGDLFNLPAGMLRASVLTKFQDWELTTGARTTRPPEQDKLIRGSVGVPNTFGSTNDRNFWQNALELSIPIIGKEWRPIPIESFEIQGSASHETIDTTSNSTSASPISFTRRASSNAIAAKLQATRDIAFRASYSSAFYPPAWASVTGSQFTSPFTSGFYPDAARGNTIQTTPWNLVGGGNPNLLSEQADSQNYGVILTPRFLPGFSLHVDYWKIEKTDAVTTADFIGAWANPAVYGFATTRLAPTPAEEALGWLGVVTQITLAPINAAKVKTEGADLRLRYTLETQHLGTFMFNANATFTDNFLLQISPTSAPVNQVNGGGAAPLKWRGLGSVTWTNRRWSATVTGRYTGKYYSAFTSPSPSYPAATALDGDHIPSFVRWDLQLSYEIPAGAVGNKWRDLVSATKWTLGVNNVLNDEPAFITGLNGVMGNGTGFYNTYDDPRQRFIYLQVRKGL